MNMRLITIVLVAAILGACSKPAVKQEVEAPLKALSCIAVLPATTSVATDSTISYEEARTLERGAAYATSVMAAELNANDTVRLLNDAQMNALMTGVSGGLMATADALAQKVNCDAILITVVERFDQRQGSELAVDAPASAKFRMVLRYATTGEVLWTADFKETQQSLFSNLFSFDKVQKRGLRWITVEQLMEQALQEKLAECPYLN